MPQSSGPVTAPRSLATGSEGEGDWMDLSHYLQESIQILQLDTGAIRRAQRDEDALVPAVAFFAVAGLASGVGQLSFRGMIFGVILFTLASFVGVGLLHVLTRLFGGHASFVELYRPLGIAATIHWVQVLPFGLGTFLGLLAALYSLLVAVFAVETVASLPRLKAILVVATLFGLSVFLGLVFLAVLGSVALFHAVFS